MQMLMKRDLCTAYFHAYKLLNDALELVHQDEEASRILERAIAHVSIEHNRLALAGTPFDLSPRKAVSV